VATLTVLLEKKQPANIFGHSQELLRGNSCINSTLNAKENPKHSKKIQGTIMRIFD